MTYRTLVALVMAIALSAPVLAQGGGNRDEDPPIPPFTDGDTEVAVAQPGRTPRGSVPMVHDSCGADCNTHSLAGGAVVIEVPIDLSVTCQPGHSVTYAAYQVQGQLRSTLVNINTGNHYYSSQQDVVPHSSSEIETACRLKFGNWPAGYEHPAGPAQQVVILERNVTAFGRCTGDASDTSRRVTTQVQATCIDQGL